MRFRESLSDTDRHFVERLESFGDVVVGFSLSLLALQLVQPERDADVFSNPLRYLVFFGTFAIIAIYWMRFTRIMATGFAPTRIDSVLVFVYLAFVALLPYSLQTYIRVGHGRLTQSVALYLFVILGVTLASLALHVRGARNAWHLLESVQRDRLWRSIVINVVGTLGLSTAIVFDVLDMPIGWAISLGLMAVAMRLTKIFFPQPRPSLLGVQETA